VHLTTCGRLKRGQFAADLQREDEVPVPARDDDTRAGSAVAADLSRARATVPRGNLVEPVQQGQQLSVGEPLAAQLRGDIVVLFDLLDDPVLQWLADVRRETQEDGDRGGGRGVVGRCRRPLVEGPQRLVGKRFRQYGQLDRLADARVADEDQVVGGVLEQTADALSGEGSGDQVRALHPAAAGCRGPDETQEGGRQVRSRDRIGDPFVGLPTDPEQHDLVPASGRSQPQQGQPGHQRAPQRAWEKPHPDQPGSEPSQE
jgi:hypothetical protein